MSEARAVKAPLSVLIIRHGLPADSEPFVGVLRKALVGSDADAYAASDYELLNPVDFRVFSWPGEKIDPERHHLKPDAIKRAAVESAEAVLVILLLATRDQIADELLAAWGDIAGQRKHVFLLSVSLATPDALPLLAGLPDGCMLSLGLSDLDERDLRRDFLTLHALNCALGLLRRVNGDGTEPAAGSQPKLFISHAKREGVPLATSILSWINDRFRRFQFFYDTLNLDLNGDVSGQLEQAVAHSFLVVLRTEIFDQRYWCQKEIFWAEKHGVPVLTVDARWNLQHAPSVVAFDSSPSVRIPDGSIVRILHSALTEGLRVELLAQRARLAALSAGLQQGQWATLARYPSVTSLHAEAERRRQSVASVGSFYIVHPNPTMPDGIREAASAVAQALMPGSEVVSLDEFRVRCYQP